MDVVFDDGSSADDGGGDDGGDDGGGSGCGDVDVCLSLSSNNLNYVSTAGIAGF